MAGLNFSNRRYAWGAFAVACIICIIACFMLFKGSGGGDPPPEDEEVGGEEGVYADTQPMEPEPVMPAPTPAATPAPPPPSSPAQESSGLITYQIGGVAPGVYWDPAFYGPSYYGPYDWWWRYNTWGKPGDPWWKWSDKHDARPHRDGRPGRGYRG